MADAGHQWCNRHVPGTTLVLAVGGGSNAGGNAGATGNPATVGLTCPAGVTVYVDDATPLTAYPTDRFGPMWGCIDELVNVLGFADPIVGVVLGQPGSTLAAWNSTYVDAMVTTYGTSGHPHSTLFVHGAQDATGGGAATYQANLTTWAGNVRKSRGAGQGLTLVGLKTSEPLVYINEAVVLAAQVAYVAANQGTVLLDASDLAQSSDSHYTAASQVTLGRRWATLLVSGQIVTI